MLAFSPTIMNKAELKLRTAGLTEPMSCSMTGITDSEDKYKTDAQEAECRIWRHCQQSHLTRHYIFPPDTDTSVIGLTSHKQGAETFIDLTPVGSEDTKIMNLNKLMDSMKSDPDCLSSRMPFQQSYSISVLVQGVTITRFRKRKFS